MQIKLMNNKFSDLSRNNIKIINESLMAYKISPEELSKKDIDTIDTVIDNLFKVSYGNKMTISNAAKLIDRTLDLVHNIAHDNIRAKISYILIKMIEEDFRYLVIQAVDEIDTLKN